MLKKLKQKKIWIPLLVIILGGTGYWIMNSSEDGEISVQAEEVIRRDIIHKVNANGKIQPHRPVIIDRLHQFIAVFSICRIIDR